MDKDQTQSARAQAQQPSFVPGVYYRRPLAAIEWLEKAFGFERTMLIMGSGEMSEEKYLHAEMSFGNSRLIVGGEWNESIASPLATGGRCTQDVHVYLSGAADAHCARARAAGAKIIEEPADQFYGARTYRAVDPEGHLWTFSQHLRTLSREEMERAGRIKFHDKEKKSDA
jgi:uncharacterized glyoxalase superfamily protein PhnB